MNVLVMGLGEVAHACSLSLLASCNVAQVTMVGRDRELLQEVQSTGHVRVGRVILPKPPRLCLSSYEDVLSHGGAGHDAVFVCTAATALFPGIYELARCTTAASGASFTERSHSPFFAALTTALRTEGNAGSSAASKSHRPLFVFTRGCSVDGRFPATALKHAFPQVPVVAVSGPVLPREWMAEAHTRENSGGATVRERQTCASASRGEVSSVGCPSVSPTSLAFAEVVAEGGVADQESNGGPRVAGIEAMAAALFPHESTTWLTYPAAAATLSFVNACTLLCAVGAGMVSNEYPASVSAQMSFLQHATTAINEVLNQLAWLAPAAGSTALPPVAMATLAMACSNLSSREFSLGRRLDFHFKKTAATDAVFQRGSSQERSLAMTMEGVYAFLSDRHIRSPFFEVILDSYSTMLRASVAGRGLVKTGVYDYVTKSAEGSELLRAALRVDEAMLSGSERSFEDAKRELAARFSPR